MSGVAAKEKTRVVRSSPNRPQLHPNASSQSAPGERTPHIQGRGLMLTRQTPSDAPNVEDIAQRYGEALDARNIHAIMSLHADDSLFHLHVSGAGPVIGREAIRASIAAFLAQFPDARFEPVRLRVGAKHWVFESTLRATVVRTGETYDAQVDNAETELEVACVDVVEVRDG